MSENHFFVEDASEDGYVVRTVSAECLVEPDDLPDLHAQVRDAVHRPFDDNKFLSLIFGGNKHGLA